MIGRTLAAAAMVAALALPGTALAQNVRAQDPRTLVDTLLQAGYRAQMDTDDAGDPLIRSSSSGSDFLIFFFGCTGNTDCRTIQFYAGYREPSNGSLEAMNQWNAENRFGRGYLTGEGSARIEMDVDLDDGGLSRELVIDNLEFWVLVMSRFEDYLGY